jgi:hypothetical protein
LSLRTPSPSTEEASESFKSNSKLEATFVPHFSSRLTLESPSSTDSWQRIHPLEIPPTLTCSSYDSSDSIACLGSSPYSRSADDSLLYLNGSIKKMDEWSKEAGPLVPSPCSSCYTTISFSSFGSNPVVDELEQLTEEAAECSKRVSPREDSDMDWLCPSPADSTLAVSPLRPINIKQDDRNWFDWQTSVEEDLLSENESTSGSPTQDLANEKVRQASTSDSAIFLSSSSSSLSSTASVVEDPSISLEHDDSSPEGCDSLATTVPNSPLHVLLFDEEGVLDACDRSPLARHVTFAPSPSGIINVLGSHEYDRSAVPVLRLQYRDMSELLELRALMREQHKLVHSSLIEMGTGPTDHARCGCGEPGAKAELKWLPAPRLRRLDHSFSMVDASGQLYRKLLPCIRQSRGIPPQSGHVPNLECLGTLTR